MKLTKAQITFLIDLAENGETIVSIGYRPAKKLIELGLVEWEHASFGYVRVRITEAGRQALKGQNDG